MKLKIRIFTLMLLILMLFQANTYATGLNLNAKSAILVEVSTGRIIYEKGSRMQMFPASTTKILTAILVIENCNLSDMVTVSETAISNIPSGYVTCNFQAGEEISVKDLLYALMVESANDAAYILAEHVADSVSAFSDMMNNKALEIGCSNSQFLNPNGIHNPNHYSTAYDLYLLAQYGMKNETFRTLVSTSAYTLPATNMHPADDRELSTTNQLINPNNTKFYNKNVIGIKTGFTSQAGNCLVTQASRDGLDFIAVILNSETSDSRYEDAEKLFNYGYDNFTLTKINETNALIDTIEIANATKETKNLNVLIDKGITVVNNKSINMNEIIPEININENLMAPILAGQTVGTIKYRVDDIEYTANLIAETNVIPKTDFSIFIFGSGILLLFIAFGLLTKKKSKKKKRR